MCRSWRWSSCSASSPGWRPTRRCRTTTGCKQGLEPLEKLDDEKVLVWPDLVYTELICMVALTAFLLVLGDRPAGAAGRAGQRGEDAESVEGPVVLPRACRKCSSTTIRGWRASCCRAWSSSGLMAIPYIDFNKKGNGYYTIDQRQVRLRHVPVRLPGAVGHADRDGHVPARSELELLRAVMKSGTRTRSKRSNNVDLSEYFWVDG